MATAGVIGGVMLWPTSMEAYAQNAAEWLAGKSSVRRSSRGALLVDVLMVLQTPD